YVAAQNVPGSGAYVGLAPPGEAGSWQRESKGYQFWTRADGDGYFSINNVRPGTYNLYAWVPGFIGEYHYDEDISVTPGSDVYVGQLVYQPPRDGPTMFRQYGLWERRYSELYPNDDLVDTIGASDYHNDWFFAQVTMYILCSTFESD
ncbi:hypothetical protein Dimus_026745, partial [Dionaea muscipula]